MKCPYLCICGLILAWLLSGCNAKLVNEPTSDANFTTLTGVPWVEPKTYKVYVYAFVDAGEPNSSTVELRPVYFARHVLGDKVNGLLIDKNRRRWMTNYQAGPFSNASYELVLHPTGGIKKVAIISTPKPEGALGAATEVLSIRDRIEEKELERLRREKELRELRRELDAPANGGS